MNIAILYGHLGADPELRYTQAGQAVLNMRLATSEKFKSRNSDQREERTDWHNIVVWGKRAEGLAKHLSKGSAIIVRGAIRTSSYEDKEGVKKYKTDIVVTRPGDDIQFAGKRQGGGGGDRDDDRRSNNSGGNRSGGNSGSGGGGDRRQQAKDSPPSDYDPEADLGGGDDDDIPFDLPHDAVASASWGKTRGRESGASNVANVGCSSISTSIQ
jgi:single-strand DNA-binding protein